MMRFGKCLLFLLLTLICYSGHAHSPAINADTSIASDTLQHQDSSLTPLMLNDAGIFKLAESDTSHRSKFKAKKLVAAILAFPVPFGLLGLHRVFLGTKPYIPFVYMGTIGGCFLILPLIDFIAILSANEESFKQFENNPKVFMWSH